MDKTDADEIRIAAKALELLEMTKGLAKDADARGDGTAAELFVRFYLNFDWLCGETAWLKPRIEEIQERAD